MSARTLKRRPLPSPVVFDDLGNGLRIPSDSRRLRRKAAPDGVCMWCWKYRVSDDKPGEMWIGDKWKLPTRLCDDCVEACRRTFDASMRRWPIDLTPTTTSKPAEAIEPRIFTTRGVGASQALSVEWQSGVRPVRVEYDPAAIKGPLYDALLHALDVILKADPTGQKPDLKLI